MTAIIVDDEHPGREEMKYLLRTYEDIDIVGVCSSAKEAGVFIEKFKPDVAFLDITMPEKDGFQLLTEIVFIPLIVFVTAHEQYALRAFEHSAIDYLLKPVNQHRLTKTIEKLRLLLSRNTHKSRNLFLRDGDRYHVVAASNVDVVESYGNYIKIHFNEKVIVQPFQFTRFIKGFALNALCQISRTTAINLDRVTDVIQEGRYLKLTVNGKIYSCSARRLASVKALLEGRSEK